MVRFQQGKFDEALKALQQAVKLSPTDAFSYSNLGIVYYQLNQYENAIDALNAAMALDPNERQDPQLSRLRLLAKGLAGSRGEGIPQGDRARPQLRRRPLQSRARLRHAEAAVAGTGPPPLQPRAGARHREGSAPRKAARRGHDLAGAGPGPPAL